MHVYPESILGVHAPPENLGGHFRQEIQEVHVPPEFVPSNHGDIPKP